MSELVKQPGDRTVCGHCGAPAEIVTVSTFEQYEPTQIRYVAPTALTVERLAAILDDEMRSLRQAETTPENIARAVLPRLLGQLEDSCAWCGDRFNCPAGSPMSERVSICRRCATEMP